MLLLNVNSKNNFLKTSKHFAFECFELKAFIQSKLWKYNSSLFFTRRVFRGRVLQLMYGHNKHLILKVIKYFEGKIKKKWKT